MKAKDLKLEQLLQFHPDKGTISFQDGRMLIVDSEAMGFIRKELIQTLGWDLARGLFARWGYQCGFNDAKKLETLFPWESETDWIMAGPIMHDLEGIVKVKPVRLEYDRIQGTFFMEGIWTNSYEAEQHLKHFPPDKSPVCWTLTGYASGYASCFMKREMVCLENQCKGRGDKNCKWTIRPKYEWKSKSQQMVQDLEGVDLSARIHALEKKIETRTQQLTEAQKNLLHMERLASAGGMAALIAHEINSPLQIIQSNLDILIANYQKEEPIFKSLKETLAEIQRLRKTLRQVLESTRPRDPETRAIDMNEVVKQICNFLLIQMGRKGIRVHIDLQKDLSMVTFDPDQLKQVLLNLITNAAEAMPHGGEIHVQTRQKENRVMVSIRDTGKGITPELRKKIFDPYFTAGKTSGYGIGLFISKQIIQKNNAHLTLKSTPGKGSTFTLICSIIEIGQIKR